MPRSLVTAARPLCETYEYLGHDNCHPVRDLGDGTVLVADAASTYNPAFYLVVGTVTRPFHGAAALEATRVVTALVCALLVAAAGWVLALWARTRWPVVALVTALTPVLVFSASVAAPNGVELCAALALWAALLGLTRPEARAHAGPLLAVGGVGATLLVTMRSIGPLWAALVVLTVAGLLGPAGIRQLLARGHRAGLAAVTLVVAVATALAVWWTLAVGVPSFEERPEGLGDPVLATLQQYPLWFLQGVAAFPRRHDAAPGLVYVVVGLATLALVAAGVAVASGRLRLVMAATAVVAVAVPFVLTVTTIETTGPIWQGRYGAPYHVGLVLLAGLALDTTTRSRRALPAVVPVGLALVVAHAASLVHVLAREARESPYAGTGAWWQPPAWLVTALVVAGFATWRRRSRRAEITPRRAAAPTGRSGPTERLIPAGSPSFVRELTYVDRTCHIGWGPAVPV